MAPMVAAHRVREGALPSGAAAGVIACPAMKLALLQIDPTVGDIEGNAALLADAAAVAARAGAGLAVASELSLLGYPPRDLLLRRAFVARGWAVCEELARALAGGPALLLGLAETNEGAGKPLYNAAALLAGGTVRRVFRKTLLPTYDVFDEDRYFEPAGGPQVLAWDGLRFGISVCEDVWNDRDFWQRPRYHSDPVDDLVAAGASCVLNLSASPFSIGKQRHREAMLGAIARKHGVPVIYVNQVGGADELVFDGRSCAFAAGGELVARAAAFAPDVMVVDLDELGGLGSQRRRALGRRRALSRRRATRQAPRARRALQGLSPPPARPRWPPTTSRRPPRCGARSFWACATT